MEKKLKAGKLTISLRRFVRKCCHIFAEVATPNCDPRTDFHGKQCHEGVQLVKKNNDQNATLNFRLTVNYKLDSSHCSNK